MQPGTDAARGSPPGPAFWATSPVSGCGRARRSRRSRRRRRRRWRRPGETARPSGALIARPKRAADGAQPDQAAGGARLLRQAGRRRSAAEGGDAVAEQRGDVDVAPPGRSRPRWRRSARPRWCSRRGRLSTMQPLPSLGLGRGRRSTGRGRGSTSGAGERAGDVDVGAVGADRQPLGGAEGDRRRRSRRSPLRRCSRRLPPGWVRTPVFAAR